jgi:gamma-glutamyl hydrolase
MSKEEVERRFKAVNGILIPGGAQDLRPGQPFFDTVQQLVDLTIEANDNGNYFPLHGVCLGMEALSVAVSRNHSILSDYDSENLPSPLFLTGEMLLNACYITVLAATSAARTCPCPLPCCCSHAC